MISLVIGLFLFRDVGKIVYFRGVAQWVERSVWGRGVAESYSVTPTFLNIGFMRNLLKIKYKNKQTNATKEGIGFCLTFAEYELLMNKAGITISDIGIKGYHLARFRDQGDYTVDNCRFIPYLENYREKRLSLKSVESSRQNMIKYNNSISPEQRRIIGQKAGITQKALFRTLSQEEKDRRTRPLPKELILQRHLILKTIQPGYSFLTRASKHIGMTPQSLGRFLRKYPM